MKTKYLIAGIFLSVVTLAHGVTNDLNAALQRGLFEEEGNRDYNAAIAAYQSLAAQFDQSRQVAATAIFRLGECYRKLGRTNEAVTQYDRILREFSDQPTLTMLSRQNLIGLKVQHTSRNEESSLEIIRSAIESAELRRKRIESIKKQNPEGLPYFLAEEDDELKNLLHLKEERKIRLASLTTKYPAQNPEIHAVRAEIETIAMSITNRIENLLIGFEIQQKAREAFEQQLANRPSKSDTQNEPATDDEEKEIRRLQKMIQDSPDLMNSPDGGHPLIRAVNMGWLKVVTYLLDHGASINVSQGDGQNAFHAAVNNGNKAMVELLRARGADLNARDGTGDTALHSAAEKGYLAVAEILIQHGANLEARNSKQNGEQTPLHRAATRGNAAMAALLMAKGADVNARDAKGVTAIGRAVQSAQLGVLNKLLAAGAQPDVEDEAGMTALSYAAAGGNVETVKALLAAKANPNAGKNNSTLFAAAGQAQLEVLKLLLSAGAKPNAKGYAGGTPLLFAIQSGHYESAAVLIQNGADANLTNDIGMTPLHMAVWAQNIPTISLLLSNRADINAPHPSGRTALGMSKEAEGGSRPFRPGDYGGQGLAPDQALARKISALLREHDALDNLPDFKTIRITRAGGGQPFVVFQKDISSVNRFTLLEVIRNFYRNAIDNREKPFPDFSRIIIQRPVFGQSGKRREITINLLTESNSFDCAKDQWLEFGDVVEIPEREHTLAEQAVGITEEQSKDLSHCLEGKVTFVVRGQKSELKLDGSAYTGWLQLSLDRVQTLLRSSSDLSHIKILRTDPATKAKQEIMADSKARQSDNVWLRDGDVIEVPDK